jgi:sugar lactone lactonase YvrE
MHLKVLLAAAGVLLVSAILTGACATGSDVGGAASPRATTQAAKACAASASMSREPGFIYTVVGCNEPGASTADGVLATSARVSAPNGAAFDQAGNLYFADRDDNRVAKVSPSGVLTTIVGTGQAGSSPNGALARAAQISHPTAIVFDRAGNLFIADFNGNRVRKVDTKGVITTVVGTGRSGHSGDGGPATAADLTSPAGLAIDSAGNLYFTELENNTLRRVDPRGVVTTVAGPDTLSGPTRIAIDRSDNIYIAESYGQRVRKMSPAGIVTTVAGNGTRESSGDGGPAAQAAINVPHGVAIDGAGNLYIGELYGYRVRKIGPDGIIRTVAGTGQKGFSGDGGPAKAATIGETADVAVDNAGDLYILDRANGLIRMVVRP